MPEANHAAGQVWPEVLVPVTIFAILQTVIFLGDHLIHRFPKRFQRMFKKDLRTFLLVELIPLPFIIVSVSSYPSNRAGLLFTMVTSPPPGSPAVQYVKEPAGVGTPAAGAFHAE